MDKPYRTILHDIMNDKEIKHIIEISKPNLSRTRYHTQSNEGFAHEFRQGKKKVIIHKTVQYWFNDVSYNKSKIIYHSPKEYEDTYFEDVTIDVLDGYDKHFMVDPIMVKLTKKFEMATQMVILDVFSSSSYQVNIVFKSQRR